MSSIRTRTAASSVLIDNLQTSRYLFQPPGVDLVEGRQLRAVDVQHGRNLSGSAAHGHDSNYVIETHLRHNLKCYGEYSILGYSRFADSGILDGWDVYHTDLPEWRLRQGVDASQISIERLPYEDYSNVYDDEF